MRIGYEYKFHRIELGRGRVHSLPKEDYQDVILDYAAKGWRFVQIFAPATTHGWASYFDLIFEKETHV